jgi:DNA-binding PadR family transcriptional regulator
MLDLAILGLLEEQELHGYEIRKRLREGLGLLANVSFGSLYPALNRLEAAGAVEATEERPEAPAPLAPPTGSLSGELAVFKARRRAAARPRRSRRVYRITPEGRRLFAELLAGGGTDDARSFGLRLAFARHLAPTARLGLLERRRATLVQRLGQARAATADPDLDPYARSVVEHTVEGVERDVEWLDRLIADERAPAGPLGVDERAPAGARRAGTGSEAAGAGAPAGAPGVKTA